MRMTLVRCKEIINLCTGHRLGFVGDVELDLSCGRLVSLIVPGRPRFFGLLGREEDYVIPFECVKRMGDDIILVEVQGDYLREKCPRRPFI